MSAPPQPGQQDKITLIVDETRLEIYYVRDEANVTNLRFVMEPSLFTQHPDTMLGRMFSGVDYVQVRC